jgi:hypothetical protein
MPDIASLGLQIDTTQVVDGKKALDQFADSSVKADQGARSLNGQMNDTAKIMRAQAAEARATAAANTALGTSSGTASVGAQIFIEKLQDQVAVLGMSRSQLAAYQAAQLGVSKEAEASVAKLKAYEDAIKAAADAKAEAAKQANILTDSIKLLVAGYGALKLGEYVKDAALLAARYETLGVVTEVVGRNAGYTKAQMDTATEAIAAQGITMLESRQSAIKLVQAHVDLKNATGLARIAQDAAVIGNINSSEAFDRLVNGISRGNVLILRNIGINVNLQSAYQQMADSIGKTTKELTENERVQARTNAVFEHGTDIAGTYTAAMDTAGKQLKSMQRYTEDLKTVIGETFNETLTIAVMALTDGLKDANKEVSELSKNQQLHEWGRSLADVFIWVANKVGNATTLLQQAWSWADHKSARDDINAKYDGQVEEALSQGGMFDVSKRNEAQRRINAERAAALAEEEVAYVTHQAKLSTQYDAFAKAGAEREATIAAKHKAETEARLKIDQDYSKAASDILLKSAAQGAAAQEAARQKVIALYSATYVGTPTFRDTEGREPKPKVDKVASTELDDRLARIQDEVNADKEMYETMQRMEDMFHAAGKMGDEEYYQLKRDHIDAALKDQVYGYNKQIAELKAYQNGTEAEAAKHAKQISDIEAKRAAAGVKAQDELSLLDAKEFLRKDAVAAASGAAANKYLAGLDQEAKKLEDANAAHETSRGAVERETIARLDLAIAYQKQFIAEQDPAKATAEEIAQGPAVLKYLEDVRAARARIAAGLDVQQSIQYKDKAADLAIKDWQRAGQTISEGLTDAFGKAGKAAGDMFKAYAQGMEGQLRAQKELIAAKKLANDDPQKINEINRAQVSGAQAQIKSYADMTTAAQGFFAEGSRGYQAMHAASVLLHSAEVALSLIKGVNAVLTQGEGDPYSAFARMAAMAAIVTGLGVALSGGGGGGGGQSAADVQKAQGTGTVFGDTSAKSDSIRRSIEQLTTNSNDMLPINQGMLNALQAIESAMTGLTNLIVRTPGLTDGSNFGVQEGVTGIGNGLTSAVTKLTSLGVGGWTESLSNGLAKLWGKTTQTVIDSGLQYGGSVRGLQQGQGFEQYASIDTTKSSFFGLSKKTSNRVEVQGLNGELSNQFGLIFTNLDKALQSAATAMGGSAADVTKVLDSLTLESTKVSLKGLTGTALTDALNSVISKSMDEIAQAAFPQLDQFRQVGEGYAETVMRIASDYSKLDAILTASGTTFGSTGMASIAARERLIELAGGIDQLASQANAFNTNFLTKAEQLAPVQKYVTDQLAAMGLQSLDTRDKFKEYVLGLANSGALATEAGAQQYTALLALAEAFAKTHAATEDLTKSEQEIADERKDLQQQYDELTLNSVDLYNKQRLAIDASNRAIADQVQALTRFNSAQDAAQGAYEKERSSLQSIIDKRLQEADATQKVIDGLKLGDLSTLSPEQKYLEAQRQFDAASTAEAKNAAAQTLLTASRTYNGSTDAYSKDYAKVQGILATQLASQKSAATIAQQQLAALDKLAGDVLGLDTSADDMAKAVRDFQKTVLELGAAMIALASANAVAGKPDTGNLGTKGTKAIDDALSGIYKAEFGRDADAAGLAFWEQQVKNGATYDQVVTAFRASDEYKAIHGSHANGLEYVPFDGYRAELHRGERVQTASQVVQGDKNGAETVALLREVITELRADKTQRGAVGVETLKKLDLLAAENAKLKRELQRA